MMHTYADVQQCAASHMISLEFNNLITVPYLYHCSTTLIQVLQIAKTEKWVLKFVAFSQAITVSTYLYNLQAQNSFTFIIFTVMKEYVFRSKIMGVLSTVNRKMKTAFNRNKTKKRERLNAKQWFHRHN